MNRYFIPRSMADFDTYMAKTNAYLILGGRFILHNTNMIISATLPKTYILAG
jgi:hypothetical protein